MASANVVLLADYRQVGAVCLCHQYAMQKEAALLEFW